ncbi:lipid II:glycine glycyltransferase FemX [Streptomyces sp. NPDC059445]|uniref:lipid II:glycine glycyltransferase FemX n=1 Tax=Streptomyces sp. NPDC059445 TaxID=3346832 RepID=UPI003691C402
MRFTGQRTSSARDRLAVTSPAPRDEWQRLVDRSDEALITQTPGWSDCICATDAYEDASRLYEFDGSGAVVVPLVRRRGWPARLIAQDAWPSEWGIGGPLAAGAPDPKQVRAVFEDLARLRANRVSLRFGPDVDPAWLSAVPSDFTTLPHTTYILDLDGGFDDVWRRKFKPPVRTAVRKGEKAGVDVEVDRTGRLVPAFYALYQHSIARWAEQQNEPLVLARWRRQRIDPLRKFQTVAETFADSCAVWLATYQGQPAAAMMVLRHGPHAKYWRAGMVKELAQPSRAPTLLHKLAIEDACAAGCRFYHMGDSVPDSSVSIFKERLGARGHPSFGYRREVLPLTSIDQLWRSAAKRLIGFKDE